MFKDDYGILKIMSRESAAIKPSTCSLEWVDFYLNAIDSDLDVKEQMNSVFISEESEPYEVEPFSFTFEEERA